MTNCELCNEELESDSDEWDDIFGKITKCYACFTFGPPVSSELTPLGPLKHWEILHKRNTPYSDYDPMENFRFAIKYYPSKGRLVASY